MTSAPTFPDYPKFGIWPDAYYNTINVFPARGFAGAEACAFDRSAMLAGAPASAICFQQPSTVSSLLPADLDGSTLPPAGSPNYFVGLADSTHLNFFRFHVDFSNPANSSFSGPTLVSVAPYSEICARATTVACIPEPQPGEKVDGLADRVMFRLAYRNFGDHESLVVNHTVKGGELTGVRWYEIRNPSAPFIYQQSTLIDPNVNYWLGSIAMDKTGNMALGFSVSSHTVFPSVYVAGRAPTDPAGATFGPRVLVDGWTAAACKSIPSNVGGTTAQCQLTPPTTALSGIPTNTTRPPEASTGQHGSVRSNSIAARDEAIKRYFAPWPTLCAAACPSV